jgi:CBS domain-containing protein
MMSVSDLRRVRDVMRRDVVTVRPDAPLHEAADKLEALGAETAPLPVVANGRIVGAVARADVGPRPDPARRATDTEGLAGGPAGRPLRRVEQVMQPGLPFCYEDQYLTEARREMEEYGFRRMPVLSRDRQLVGEVRIVDLTDRAVDERSDNRS